MKLIPYYVLFSLAFLGLLSQKAYEYKLDQDDKNEVFCKNALFLLDAPDSLNNKVIDFDLNYDFVVKELKNKVFIDSCNTDYFDFSSKAKFQKYKKSEQVVILFPLYLRYQSKCYSDYYLNCFDSRYHIVFKKNLENYSESSYEENSIPLDSLETRIIRRENFNGNSQIRVILEFNDKTNQTFLEKVITVVSKMSIEKYKEAAIRNYGKQLCNLNKFELIDLKTRISRPNIEVLLHKFNFQPPPPFQN